MRIVEVCNYNPDWPKQFQLEAERLKNLFGDELLAVHHIGSTAVPGLQAKPVLDLLPVVRDIRRVDTFNQAMRTMGYQPKGEYGIPGRRFFIKGGNRRTHHVHVFQHGDPEIHRHLVFRDYLRAHPHEAERYGKLKAELALKHPWDIEAYMAGKAGLVRELERAALEWARENTLKKSP
jgi:GrpB-like predicted nucleotidyltransferase (UPF0157 family)